METTNVSLYSFYDNQGNIMISLVKIIETYNIGAKVKVLKCYQDTPFGLYKYLASHNGEANASKKYLYDITKFVREYDHKSICEILNNLFGVDGMYFGVDTHGISVDICRYCHER